MPLPNPSFSEAERALGERLRKLAAETDQVEGYSQPHAERLAQLAEAVGRRCGLHDADLSSLKLASWAHDLGERKLKRDYLRRPSKLTWEEQLDLWRHPILGEQEAQNLKLPREVQLLVRWHHEWWNGTGYPDGLTGTAIPLGARILRAVDTWCALRSDRPNRGAYNDEAAEQKLLEQTGIECDPQVVKALLAVLAEERADLEVSGLAAIRQSYETVPMEAVTVDSEVLSEAGEHVSNVIEMPTRNSESFETAIEAAEKDHADPVGTETSVPSPVEPSVVSFDMPTIRPYGDRPAPPAPPPVRQNLNQSLSLVENKALLDDSPDAEPPGENAPVMMVPTEEVPVVDLTMTNSGNMRSKTLGLGSFLPEPEPLRSTPLTVVPSAKLHVVALSEVPDHFWLVAKWIYEEWWETPDNSIGVVSNALKEHLASTTLPQTFVALLDGQPVGSISLTEKRLPERSDVATFWLDWLYVLPEHRRQGFGSRLLEGAFTRAKLQGAETVHAVVPAAQEGYFIRHGWQVVEREVGPQRLSLITRNS